MNILKSNYFERNNLIIMTNCCMKISLVMCTYTVYLIRNLKVMHTFYKEDKQYAYDLFKAIKFILKHLQ